MAHLDIAGMAFSKYGGALNSSGATGFGVRLLNKLMRKRKSRTNSININLMQSEKFNRRN